MYKIIPKPSVVTDLPGQLVLSPSTAIIADATWDEATAVATLFANQLRELTGLRLVIESHGARQGIFFTRDMHLTPESYRLHVTPEAIYITAADKRGLIYGAQTLLQMLEITHPAGWDGLSWCMPCVEIEDRPRFTWRGMHLDVARHFMPIAGIKQFIKLLAFHKLNTLHLHLTEDQGWRIEIPQYPRLATVSAWRETTITREHEIQIDTQRRHGGCYTQQELRDLVAYAAQYGVNIVPEIELPGHALAALAAYPELSCTGGPFEVGKFWGIFEDVYCAGNDQVLAFLEAVLMDVMAIFPSEFIHIGGDECPKTRWLTCPKCQARMAAENLADGNALQSWLVRRMDHFLQQHGRRLVGWDEILEGGLAQGATVMSWRGEEGGITAAQSGHDVIMTPTYCTYFDFYQSEDQNSEPTAIGGYLPLEAVYGYEPIPEVLTPEAARHVLGAQGQLWSEYISNAHHMEYMAFPRACALAEVLWSTPEARDYQEFLTRLRPHLKRLDNLGVNYRGLEK